MTEQNVKIDGRTKRPADIALAKRQISPASYRALVEEGTITLQQAKELGRDRGPDDTSNANDGPQRTSERPRSASVGDRREGRSACLCGCGGTPMSRKSRFLPGHDHRLFGEFKRNLTNDPLLKNERFTEEQKAYAKERGLLDG